MADVSQLEVNGTTYNICDATARDSLSHVLELVYPIGSVYINASDSTNPATLLGFGTWERVGTGRVMIDANSTYAAGSTGGSATHTHTTGDCTLTAAQSGVPAHAHGLNSHTHSVGAHSHGLNSHTHTLSSHTHKYAKPNTPTGSTAITVAQMPKNYAKFTVRRGWNSANTWYPGAFTDTGWNSTVANSTRTDINPWDMYVNSGASNGTTITLTGGGNGHTHTIGTTSTASEGPSSNTSGAASGNTASSTAFDSGAASGNTANNTAAAAASAHNHGDTGSGSTIQPWVGVYMWKRTA